MENAYVGMENDLQRQIDNIPSTYPGYDEYRYDLDEIMHNPHELASFLRLGRFRRPLRGPGPMRRRLARRPRCLQQSAGIRRRFPRHQRVRGHQRRSLRQRDEAGQYCRGGHSKITVYCLLNTRCNSV